MSGTRIPAVRRQSLHSANIHRPTSGPGSLPRCLRCIKQSRGCNYLKDTSVCDVCRTLTQPNAACVIGPYRMARWSAIHHHLEPGAGSTAPMTSNSRRVAAGLDDMDEDEVGEADNVGSMVQDQRPETNQNQRSTRSASARNPVSGNRDNGRISGGHSEERQRVSVRERGSIVSAQGGESSRSDDPRNQSRPTELFGPGSNNRSISDFDDEAWPNRDDEDWHREQDEREMVARREEHFRRMARADEHYNVRIMGREDLSTTGEFDRSGDDRRR